MNKTNFLYNIKQFIYNIVVMIDLEYICDSISNISGIPVRLYCDKRIIKTFSIINLPIDPIQLYEEEILDHQESIYTYSAPYFYYYGLINFKNYQIVLGPSSTSGEDMYALSLLYDLNVAPKDKTSFLTALKTSSILPFNTFLEMLIMINYVLNNKKKSISEFLNIVPTNSEVKIRNQKEGEKVSKEYHYNSLAIEKEMLNIVKSGDLNLFKNFVSGIKTVRSGFLSKNPLKQDKILFICTVTLIARAAIDAGVDSELALTLSDNFIQRCELCNKEEDIRNLNYECLEEYTKMVSYVKNNNNSPLANKVTNYILQNISSRISLDEIANHFFISKTYLCKMFKKENGITLNNFILKKKVEISKLLLEDETKTISFISNYLGFSSQPHFTKTFIEFENISPKEYRSKIKRGSL